ncbi:multifunctional transcriptional regulator/nicotinamide-nucleotide adenylyltransferase/ribosylnicotinamide kinase NadR [soil metagenome]
MVKAFVFGKFLPFHKGHQAMIDFALAKCDLLTVLICCSDKETIDADTRSSWIKSTYTGQSNVQVIAFEYKEDELPNTSVSSEQVSKMWANTFQQLLPDYSLLITSEPYGDYLATFMGIKHLGFDVSRTAFPISATKLRNNLFQYWDYLPNSVKQSLALKVVILGTESTGKTVLAERLAADFNCTYVAEAARGIIANSNHVSFDDLTLVAHEHAKRISEKAIANSPLLVIDTDIHTTKSYSQLLFGRKLMVTEEIYQTNKAQLYLYLNNDVEYIQDGTRLAEYERNLLDTSLREVLKRHHIPIIEIKGNWDERYAQARQQVNNLLAANHAMQFRYPS